MVIYDSQPFFPTFFTGIGQLMVENYDKARYMQALIGASSVVVIFFFLSIPSWDSPSANVAFNSVLAFSAMMCAAWAYINRKAILKTTNLLIALLFRGIIHFIAMANNLFDNAPASSTLTPHSTFFDLLELYILLLVILLTFRYQTEVQQFLSSGPKITGVLILTLIGYGLLTNLVLPDIILVLAGIFIGAACLTSGYWSLDLLNDNKELYTHTDLALLRCSLLFFSFSAVPLMIAILIPSVIWIMAMCLQMAAFLILLVSFAIKPLKDIGLTFDQTVFVPLSIALLLVIPFLAAVLVAGAGITVIVPNSIIYLLVRFGAMILSMMMLYLLYSYSKINPKYIQYPLMLLFTLWSAVQLSLIVFFSESYYITEGEPLSPYITGSLILTILLLVGVYKLSDEKATLPSRHGTRIAIWFIVIFFLGWLSQELEFIFLDSIGGLSDLPISSVTLLGVILATVFSYVILQFEVINKESTPYSLETLVIGLLAIWLIPIILKGSFESWTIGWWSAELLLVSGLVIGPFFMGFYYLRSMADAEQARRMSSLLSDLLIHDVGNVTHAAMISLELAREGEFHESADAAQDIALDSLKQAKRIIENVRTLAKAENASESLVPTDIVKEIWAGYHRAIAETLARDVNFSVEASCESCYTKGNELLTELFANLFSNSIRYSGEKKNIEVKIDTFDSYWRIDVIDNGQGISPEKRRRLFTRHMKGASGSGLGLSVVRTILDHHHGSVTVHNRVPEDYTKGTKFTILLPCYND
jgi:signal transduction histidine kinase